MLLSVANFPSAKIVLYKIINRTLSTVVQDWTTNGVIEDLIDNTAAISLYSVNTDLLLNGSEFVVLWKTTDATPLTAAENINKIETRNIMPEGIVVASPGNTNRYFYTTLNQTVNDFAVNAWLKFTSGILTDQVQEVIGYATTNGIITVKSPFFTTTPNAGDKFVLINE
jgi:hypothetical protein